MAQRRETLHLHEEILLLALRDEKGTVIQGPMYQHAMAGAILAELLLAKRIEVEEGRKKLVNVLSDKPMGEPVIDESLEKMATARRRATLQTWVSRLTSIKRFKHRVAEGLCRRKILKADEGTVLLIFRRKLYPEVNPQPERKLIERMRKAIFTATRDVDPRTVVLISLAKSADLLKIPFDKKKLRQRKERIARLTSGEIMGKATREAVQATQAAVTVACIMPAITAAAVSH